MCQTVSNAVLKYFVDPWRDNPVVSSDPDMSNDPKADPEASDSTGEVRFSFVTGDFLGFQSCFICRPTDFIVSEEDGIKPRTVVPSVLAVRCSKIFFAVNVFWFWPN
jgi:hypothetical protein